MATETAFNMASSNIRYGPGATREIGMDLADMGVKKVLVVTDPNLSGLEPVSICSRGRVHCPDVRGTPLRQN